MKSDITRPDPINEDNRIDKDFENVDKNSHK
jgi:hypothetical protein